jgi:hypothetical protein
MKKEPIQANHSAMLTIVLFDDDNPTPISVLCLGEGG